MGRVLMFGPFSVAGRLAFASETEETLPAFAREMLTAHNAVRRNTGVPPLKWSKNLAARAEAWAKTLAANGASRMQGVPGQNIAYTVPAGAVKGAGVVAAWAAEATNYDHQKNACIDPNGRCHPYTQVVWRNSRLLGCAGAPD